MAPRQRLLPLLAYLLLVAGVCGSERPSGAWSEVVRIFSTRPPPGKACAPTSSIPIAGHNLTAEERSMLQYLCWPEDPAEAERQLQLGTRRGVPPGVTCKTVTWCDGDVCTEVCEAGSVVLEPWLTAAARLQARLSRQLPFCFATVLGTHNSGISLADGYGNLDPYFQQYFKYVKWAVSDFSDAPLRTNDQWLSLTDQLNMGVRALELDTHWVGGALRIAHCGGIHIDALNQLIRAINLVAKLLHRHIRWDTETLGCMPSLSSIPSMEQRTLVDAMSEVKAWMDEPGNQEEFVVLFFDDQPDLTSWGVVEHLQTDIRSVFPPEMIFTTNDHAAHEAAHGNGSWPSAATMVAAGKRLLLVSRADYGDPMRPLVFSRSATVCGWTEPNLSAVEGLPTCIVHGPLPPSSAMGAGKMASSAAGSGLAATPAAAAATSSGAGSRQAAGAASGSDGRAGEPLFDGTLFRVETCELEYGPLNCDFVFRGTNEPYLDEATMPAVLGCGLNVPSPDLLTPSKAAAAIWTWAPGHPYDPITNEGAEANCAVMSASDGRWRAVPCEQALPSACRASSAPPAAAANGGDGGTEAAAGGMPHSRRLTAASAAEAGGAALRLDSEGREGSAAGPAGLPGDANGLPSLNWVLSAADAGRGACPEGSVFDIPRHPVDNFRLASLLKESGHEQAWLPLSGPNWEAPVVAPVAGSTA
ncbi:hypothetical protein N2152v2_002158 [Parachlorella kessleri]